MNSLYPRDGMGGYSDMEDGFNDDMNDASNSGLANSFQCEYQELNLDPVVTNLNLDRVHPTIQNLAHANQASVASSLLALQKSAHNSPMEKAYARSHRPDLEASPSKRMRTSSMNFSQKGGSKWETPVRDRVDTDGGSPPRGRSMSGFESPLRGRDSAYSTPSNGVASPPPVSPQSRRQEEEHAMRSATFKRNVDSNPNKVPSSSDMHAPRTPDSEEEELSPPPSAASKGKGGSKSRGRVGAAPSAVPSSADKNKKEKGLREFSLRVCRQVEAKMVTTYNEVADELVKEFKNDDPTGDEKNIRRRAYDALNVLTAMDIISKDKKDIQWKGFPSLSGDGKGQRSGFSTGGENEKERLKHEIREKQKEVEQKEGQLEDLSVQYLSLLQLLKRNERTSRETVNQHRIYLPFVLVSTDSDNTIECDISDDKRRAKFNFRRPFELHDDRETLNMMSMFRSDPEALKELLPSHLASFIRQRRPDVVDDEPQGGVGGSPRQIKHERD
mmetsp:Transcript_45962/g.115248  ORF Transcript_45962/g.115248 Transcript_45962/m.115248 type:complete len:500 (+) Transcript_45962:242-1741(+)